MSNLTDFFPAVSGGSAITNQLGVFNVNEDQFTDSNGNVWLKTGKIITDNFENYPNATISSWSASSYALTGQKFFTSSLGSVTFADGGNRVLVATTSGAFSSYTLGTTYDIATASGNPYDSDSASAYFANDLNQAIYSNNGSHYYFSRTNSNSFYNKDTSSYGLGANVTNSASISNTTQNAGFWFGSGSNEVAFMYGTNGNISKYTFSGNQLSSPAIAETFDWSSLNQIITPSGIALDSLGKVMLLGCSTSDTIYSYKLTTPFSLSSVVFESSIDVSSTLNIRRFSLSDDGSVLLITDNSGTAYSFSQNSTIETPEHVGILKNITPQTFVKIN